MSQIAYKNALGAQFISGVERHVVVRCGVHDCANTSSGLWQRQDGAGDWMPAVVPELNKLGWVEQDATLFCSKQCAHKSAYSKKTDLAVTAVRELNDATYQKNHVPMPDRVPAHATRTAPKLQTQTRSR